MGELGDIGEDLGLSGGQPLEGGEPIQAFKEEEAEIPVAASGPNYAAFGNEEVQGMTSGMSGMTMREEPECIKKWKLEQEEMLKKKDADEEQKKKGKQGTRGCHCCSRGEWNCPWTRVGEGEQTQ